MDFNILQKPPTSGDKREEYRWLYRLCEIVNGLRSIALDHDNTKNIHIADLTNTDNIFPKHITNLQGKAWEDHRLKQSDDTLTDTLTEKHVTNNQVKKYEDHRLAQGNPHNTKSTDLEDVSSVAAAASGQILIWLNTIKKWMPSINITIDDTTRTVATNTYDFHVACGTDKTLVLDETVWQDIDFPIVIRTTGVGIPVLAAINGGLTMPIWAVGDVNICESQELVHIWKEGTNLFWHLHLTTNGTDAADRYVKFELEYGYANVNGTWTFPAIVTTGDLLIPANTPTKTMLIFPLGTLSWPGGKISAHILPRLKRIASVGAAPTGNPWIPTLQLHIEVDTMGSRLMGTK